MKKTIQLLLVFALGIVTTAQAQFWGNKSVKGNGTVTTITRSTSGYDAISCGGSMDFILVSGNEGSIKIEGEENLLEYIITEVKDNKLAVRVEHGVNLKPSWNIGIKITIPFKDINYVSLAGSGDVWNTDMIIEDDLKVSLSGSGDIKLSIKTQNLDSTVTGSGDITITGSTDNLQTKVTGSGDFHGFNLQANFTDAAVTGSGNIDVVSNKALKARVTGSGYIDYRGNPDKEDTKVIGSGSISK
jgi:hypothetical protein